MILLLSWIFLTQECLSISIIDPASDRNVYALEDREVSLPCIIDAGLNEEELLWSRQPSPNLFKATSSGIKRFSAANNINIVQGESSGSNVNYSLLFTPFKREDFGVYSCVILSPENPTRLITAKKPELTLNLTQVTTQIQPDEPIEFLCMVSGEPENWSFRWYRQSKYNSTKVDISQLASEQNSQSTLRISQAKWNHNGKFFCEASNGFVTKEVSSGDILVPFAPREAPDGFGGTKVDLLERNPGVAPAGDQFVLPFIVEPSNPLQITWKYAGPNNAINTTISGSITICNTNAQAGLCFSVYEAEAYGYYKAHISNEYGSTVLEARLISPVPVNPGAKTDNGGPDGALIGGIVAAVVVVIVLVVILIVLYKRGVFGSKTNSDPQSNGKDRRTPEERQFSDIVHESKPQPEEPVARPTVATRHYQPTDKPSTPAYVNNSAELGPDVDNTGDYPRYVPASTGGQVNLGLEGEGALPAYSPSDRSYRSSPPKDSPPSSPPPTPPAAEYKYSKDHDDWRRPLPRRVENESGLPYSDIRHPAAPPTPTGAPRTYQQPESPSVYANINFSPTTV